ncbi:protein FATTY ACID EXPORT 2, chloroplastic-like [Musa acuminata AAA Group]|uniref:protein FATTY ACID EXPORT 2, chloroplastic-like n=1 Tax=Musa acuminata AAA Group TaxID=214697 RepID=UPI0031D52C1A
MAVASTAAAVVLWPASQSALFLRRPSSLASKLPSHYPPRASCALRSAALVTPLPRPTPRRPETRLFADESESPDIEVEIENDGGSGGGIEGSDGGSGGGGKGGDDGKNGGAGDSGESEEGGADKEKKVEHEGGMSMSQKVTLGYAALVGVGGIMGYVKSGSQKSLAVGGIAALLLYFVYTLLPVRPAFASSLGLGLSAALLVVMGSRFKKSGKIFPAGIVSVVSFIMVGGYFHGILRSSHV